MRESLCARIQWRGETFYAKPEGDHLILLSGTPIDGLRSLHQRIPVSEATFLPPVPATKLIGIGANFPGEEAFGPDPYPSFFIKPPTAFLGHLETVHLPPVFLAVAGEGELGVVVRRRCKNLTKREAVDAILGWTIVNDLSGRESTLAAIPPAVKKSADGFAPMGPYINLDATPRRFELTTWRNGALVQKGTTESLRFDVLTCLMYVSSIMTLEPYDVLALGTPPPKPLLQVGDEVAVTIPGIGTLTNRIGATRTRRGAHTEAALEESR